MENIYNQLLRSIEKNQEAMRDPLAMRESSTTVKFYDSLEGAEKGSENKQLHNRPDLLSKITSLLAYMFIVSSSLPEFQPKAKDKSEIIDNANMKLIAYFLPGLIRMREWRLLFSINHDGVSMQTFYNLMKNRDNTVILIKDEHDRVFGCYCCEEWRNTNRFYGRGESFVFFFDDEEDIRVFPCTGLNDNIQFSDERNIMVGGGKE